MTHSSSLSNDFSTIQRSALVVGGIGLIAAVILGYFTGGETFFQSYLFAFLFWLGLALGCLIMLFVQHVAGGSWGALIRRPLESGAMVLPVMAVLFIPLIFGMGSLFEWTNAEFVANHPLVAAKTGYLNTPFFIARAILYFAIWGYGAWYFFQQSGKQDKSPEQSSRIGFRLKSISGPWIVIYVATMTFAAIDWSMSLTPEFFSGIYSVIIMIGQAITAVCFLIFITVYLASKNKEFDELLTSKRLQDLGNFLMAFTMFWAYTSIAQAIILWSNNIIETNPYYVLRFSPAWQGVGLFLMFFGFAAPFVILFSRWVKRKRQALVVVAIWAIFVRLLDLFYIVIPNFEREGFALHLLDVVMLVAMGGIWLAAFAFTFKTRSVLPLHDPRLPSGEAHHG